MRIIGGFTLLIFGVMTGLAAPVLSPPSPPCSLFGVGPPDNIGIQYSIWTAPDFNCQQQDKIFSNFAVSGALPNTAVLQLQQQTLGVTDFHIVTFNGNFLTPFAISYDIAVDLVMNPLMRIVRVSGDLSNPTRIGDPEAAKAIFTSPGGVFLGSISSRPLNPGLPLIVSETALHVADVYAPNGGGAVSMSNTFAQTEIPEPSVALLIGSGLFLLSRRFKRS